MARSPTCNSSCSQSPQDCRLPVQRVMHTKVHLRTISIHPQPSAASFLFSSNKCNKLLLSPWWVMGSAIFNLYHNDELFKSARMHIEANLHDVASNDWANAPLEYSITTFQHQLSPVIRNFAFRWWLIGTSDQLKFHPKTDQFFSVKNDFQLISMFNSLLY